MGGLAWATNDRSLEDAFSRFGQLTEARVVMEREDPSRSRGFGYGKIRRARTLRSMTSGGQIVAREAHMTTT